MTIALSAESMPKKKSASIAVMMRTMIAVVRVSFMVGQTTLLPSARTCRIYSPGETFATAVPILFVTVARAS